MNKGGDGDKKDHTEQDDEEHTEDHCTDLGHQMESNSVARTKNGECGENEDKKYAKRVDCVTQRERPLRPQRLRAGCRTLR